MKMNLAENIRRFRKDRSLTQEQLSEALGVTAGAVYKWEAKLSIPELELIVEMADFFDTSVDILLGYEVKDNSLDVTGKRLQEYRRRKDPTGLTEAEKALKKYPHSFEIVKESAALYGSFGIVTGNKDFCQRALELLKRSLLLLPQNTDPEISEETIYGKIATIYLCLNEPDKAIEIYKAHNAGGMYNHQIGHTLALCERTEEAAPFLSDALARIVSDLVITIIGYTNVFFQRSDYASAEAILHWGSELLSRLREAERPNYLDKVNSGLLAALAASQYMSGQEDTARGSLIRAKELAAFFDAAPSYDMNDIRFIERVESASAYDDIGMTALDAIENVIRGTEKEAFTALWRSVRSEGETP